MGSEGGSIYVDVVYESAPLLPTEVTIDTVRLMGKVRQSKTG